MGTQTPLASRISSPAPFHFYPEVSEAARDCSAALRKGSAELLIRAGVECEEEKKNTQKKKQKWRNKRRAKHDAKTHLYNPASRWRGVLSRREKREGTLVIVQF